MNYLEFVRIVEHEINHHLEGGMKAKLHTAIKNNNQKRIGIVVERPGVNISPTIYLEEFYAKYHSGIGISEISREILTFYESVKCEKSVDLGMVEEYERIRSRIVFRVINTEKNQSLLEKVPHIDFLDLSIVFYALIDASQEGTATMLIYNDNVDCWGIDSQELLVTAIGNSENLLPAQLLVLKNVVEEIINPFVSEPENLLNGQSLNENEHMYVLSNPIRSFGAACMVYPGMLKTLGEILKKDYYLLPSSIHEVILVTKEEGMSLLQMTNMVREVNREQVAAEEVLSDHAYFYSRKREKLLMAEC